MINLTNVTKVYCSKKGRKTTALKDVNLSLGNNGMTFITGESGSGKSTLLNIISGIDLNFTGKATLFGNDLRKLKSKEIDSYRSNIGYIFQDYCLITNKTVKENLSLVLKINNITDSNLIDEALSSVGLEGVNEKYPYQLSGGEQQRVAIARAIIKKPMMIICDEPTGALDEKNTEAIFSILKDISETIPVIIVTHDIEQANKYSTNQIEISNGEIIKNTCELTTDEEKLNLMNKNKLPLKESFKLSISNFKIRKVRLTITMILLIVCFSTLSMAYSLSTTKKSEIILNSIKDNGYQYVSILDEEIDKKNEKAIEYLDANNFEYEFSYNPFNDDSSYYWDLRVPEYFNDVENHQFSSNKIYGFNKINSDLLKKYSMTLTSGRLPEASNEINITTYIAEMFIEMGYEEKYSEKFIGLDGKEYYTDSYREIAINSHEEMLGKTLFRPSLSGNKDEFKIVGIVDTGFDFNRYSKLKKSTVEELHHEEFGILSNELYFTRMYNSIFIYDEYDTSLCTTRYMNVFLTGNKKVDLKFIEKFTTYDGTHDYVLLNEYNEMTEHTEDILKVTTIAGYVLGIVSFIFVIIVLVGYMNNIVNDKKKEIGVLKALGVSNFKVSMIYIFQSLILCISSFVCVAILSTLLTLGYNIIISKTLYVELSFITIPFILYFEILLIMIILCLLSISFPLRKYVVKNNPLEAIRESK